jgi:hypothetical protein
MSGGSWEYLCYKVQDAAQRLCEEKCNHRKAFGIHLRKVAEALHDIEWVDSCDYGPGDDIKSMMKCIKPQDVLNASVEDATNMIARLEEIIALIKE